MPTITSPSFEETTAALGTMFLDPLGLRRACTGQLGLSPSELDHLSRLFDCPAEDILLYSRSLPTGQSIPGLSHRNYVTVRLYVADSTGQALWLIAVDRQIRHPITEPGLHIGEWVRIHQLSEMEPGHLDPAINHFLKCDEATFVLTAATWAINPAPAAIISFASPPN